MTTTILVKNYNYNDNGSDNENDKDEDDYHAPEEGHKPWLVC